MWLPWAVEHTRLFKYQKQQTTAFPMETVTEEVVI